MRFDNIERYKSFIIFNNDLGNELHKTVSKEISQSIVSSVVLQLDRFINNDIQVSIIYSVRKNFLRE